MKNQSGQRIQQSKLTFLSFLALAATVYISSRLWQGHREIERLRSELYNFKVEDAGSLGSTSRSRATGDCSKKTEPSFYSIRPISHGDIPDRIKDIGVKFPSKEDVLAPTSKTSIASIDTIEEGFLSGWACNREETSEQTVLTGYVGIDGHIVSRINIDSVEEDPTTDMVAVCRGDDSKEQDSVPILTFNVSLPRIPLGIHQLRLFIADPKQPEAKMIEAFHSPVQFEESTREVSAQTVIARKDKIITQRNNQLTKLWDEIETQLPWRRAENDAEEISLEGSETPEYTAVILVQSDAQNADKRMAIRKTWGSAKQQKTTLVKFLVDNRFSGPHKEKVQQEYEAHGKDLILMDAGVSKSLGADRVLFGLQRAVKQFDARYYFISKDTMLVFPERLEKFLKPFRNQGNLYLGCMKSGAVVTEPGSSWFEKDSWRFGDKPDEDSNIQYPRHASGDFYGFTRAIARHLARSRQVLQAYANEDTSVGAWMLGLQISHKDEGVFCCSTSECSPEKMTGHGTKCIAFNDASCTHGMCDHPMEYYYRECGK
ncbi:hypothetical protein M9434_001487 [Picochlorum sp. BPE23]|nr:hypothetical protein M9434_001487 [Picochlorum sp. BPE23]